jgi:hypothetical protein
MKQIEHNALRPSVATRREAEPHPEEKVLTAFAEERIPADERETVLGHLARCEDCRRWVRARAQAALDRGTALVPASAPPTRAPRSVWRDWLTWAGIATGLVVAGGVTVVLRERTETAAPPAQVATDGGQADAGGARPDGTAVLPAAPPGDPTRAPGDASGSAGAGVRSLPAPAAAPRDEEPETALAGSAPVSVRGKDAIRSATWTHWRITEGGAIERAVGDGAWEPVEAGGSSGFRVLTVAGTDLWAGGDERTLIHSTDGGATWAQVALPDKGPRNASIARIRVAPAQALLVEANDGTSWTTRDGGRSWQ